MIRVVLLALMVLAGGALANEGAAPAVPMIPVRSIDPGDEDFADLEPLAKLIGTARVVQLGEESHGDGGAFYAKARLVKFLHQRMGFDVVAWESGLLDCRLAAGAMRRGEPARVVAQQGIFPIWSKSRHVLPTFEYMGQTQSGLRPIEFCGFDCQISGKGAEEAAGYVGSFFGRVDPGAFGEDGREKFRGLLRAARGGKVSEAERQAGVAEVGRLIGLLSERERDVVAAHGGREAAFMRQFLRGLLAFEESSRREGGASPEQTNVRDQAMGENLVWLANEYYAGRKVIVWAASFHLMHDAAGIRPVGKDLSYEKTVVMGDWVKRALKDEVFTVAFTAHSGRAGNPFFGGSDLPAAPEGSMEDRLHRAGAKYAVVDLRGGPWSEEMVARPLGYSPMRARWGEHFDAMFYVDREFPSTSDGRVPEGVVSTRPATAAASAGGVHDVPHGGPVRLEEVERADDD